METGGKETGGMTGSSNDRDIAFVPSRDCADRVADPERPADKRSIPNTYGRRNCDGGKADEHAYIYRSFQKSVNIPPLFSEEEINGEDGGRKNGDTWDEEEPGPLVRRNSSISILGDRRRARHTTSSVSIGSIAGGTDEGSSEPNLYYSSTMLLENSVDLCSQGTETGIVNDGGEARSSPARMRRRPSRHLSTVSSNTGDTLVGGTDYNNSENEVDDEDTQRLKKHEIGRSIKRLLFLTWCTGVVLLCVACHKILVECDHDHTSSTQAWLQSIKIDMHRLEALDSLAISLSDSRADASSLLPLKLDPNFNRRGEITLSLAHFNNIFWAPIIQGDAQREAWEEHVASSYLWLTSRGTQINSTASYPIHNQNGAMNASEKTYLPLAQAALNLNSTSNVINANLLSYPGLGDLARLAIANEAPATGKFVDLKKRKNELKGLIHSHAHGPFTDFLVPIFHDGQIGPTERDIQGVLFCTVDWRDSILHFLTESYDGTDLEPIDIEVRNSCGESSLFSFDGNDIVYVGQNVSSGNYSSRYPILGDDLTSLNASGFDNLTACHYDMSFIQENSGFVVARATMYTGILAAFFVLSTVAMLWYDCLVERRNQIVLKAALASNAIVSSLFPKIVRDRLYSIKEGAMANTSASLRRMRLRGRHQSDHAEDICDETSIKTNDAGELVGRKPHSGRRGSEFGTASGSGFVGTTESSEALMVTNPPIADRYLHTSVLFADIAGFTAWSSDRDPAQVFILLETLYGAFDRIAKRRKVFKVETIGDCYLAVTGLPDPQQNHALIICQFANECLGRMHELMDTDLRWLVKQSINATVSGPEVKPAIIRALSKYQKTFTPVKAPCLLNMRFGIHSGAVTAGVLRGEKARFQLFGDTVNTAARMESNGIPGRIQVSEATANLIKASGKGHWLVKRSKKVEAKGKGLMQTYWVKQRARISGGAADLIAGAAKSTKAAATKLAEKSGKLSEPIVKAGADLVVLLSPDGKNSNGRKVSEERSVNPSLESEKASRTLHSLGAVGSTLDDISDHSASALSVVSLTSDFMASAELVLPQKKVDLLSMELPDAPILTGNNTSSTLPLAIPEEPNRNVGAFDATARKAERDANEPILHKT